ncbi:MAG: cysteine hydrolase family protein [Pseudomonadota bacterium]
MTRALLAIDVQNEYFSGLLPVSHPAGSLNNILWTMDRAAALKMPTVVIQHTSPGDASPVFVKGTPGWELHPEIAARPRDLVLEKTLPGAFTGTGLLEWLTARKITSVTICGYMTQMCCDTTARQACHRGLGVDFLSDATGTLDITNQAGSVTAEELHRAILVTQAMRFSRVLTTAEWLKALES